MAKQRVRKQKPEGSQPDSSKKYVSAYKRAEQNLAKIQEERKRKANERQRANKEKNRKLEENLSYRKRMNNVLKQRTKKGQPRLNAQVELLLEKLEKRISSK